MKTLTFALALLASSAWAQTSFPFQTSGTAICQASEIIFAAFEAKFGEKPEIMEAIGCRTVHLDEA